MNILIDSHPLSIFPSRILFNLKFSRIKRNRETSKVWITINDYVDDYVDDEKLLK